MAKSNLPIEVHDHFQKANVLHGYFLDGIQNNIPYAIETGIELLAAKAAIPHGSWVVECERLFDGSLRNAQFYMQLAKNMEALPKAQKSAVLFLETTLEGAAKAAKDAANPRPPNPEPEEEPDDIPAPEGEPEPSDCDELDAHNAHTTKPKPDPKPITALTGRARDLFDAHAVVKTWADAVGRWMSGEPSIDKYRDIFPGMAGDRVINAAKELWTALEAWKKVLK
jgi:hypothetical protein